MRKGNWDKIKAFFSVIIYHDSIEKDGVTINNCKLIEGSNGLFVSSPSEKNEINGEVKYFPIVWLGKDILNSIVLEAKKEYEKDEVQEMTIEDLPNL
tara:strand:- start:736 stop:1026 length:291 start_codon:yes stop_codon:yes gene_type:complete